MDNNNNNNNNNYSKDLLFSCEDKNPTKETSSRSYDGEAEEEDVNIVSNIFATPCKHQPVEERCAVCLSPLFCTKRCPDCQYDRVTLAQEVSETECQHRFHTKCLDAIKRSKCECPLCRRALSPLQAPNVNEVDSLKEEIRRAAQRGRQAVRSNMLRNGILV